MEYLFNYPGIHKCVKCKNEIKNDLCKCKEKCDVYFCMNCIYNQELEKDLIKTRLNNSIFKIIINNYLDNNYGCLLKRTKNQEIIIFINKEWDDIKYYI